MLRGSHAAKGTEDVEEGNTLGGFTRDMDMGTHEADVDDDELIDDDAKSEEPDDGESLDDKVDE